ncbi:MAG: DUF4255 domain-containing protein [Candidatus Sericytochromatia bacterium]
MSASTAIGSVSASLQRLLRDKMRLDPPVNVTLLAPDEAGADRRVNLFLYRIEESPFLKNQDAMVSIADPTRLQAPPLSLDLFYLMTVYAPNDPDTGNAEAHHILGEAMRVLHDNTPIPRTLLSDDLRDARERLQIAPHKPDTEELNHIWTTFSKPFRPTVLYQVSSVQLDAAAGPQSTVPQRVRTVGVPDVTHPVKPPTIDSINPAAGRAGSRVTFAGHNLAGRGVTVIVGTAVVRDDTPAEGDTVTVTVPPDLAAAFYEIRVDVGSACRRTFLFEVTP